MHNWLVSRLAKYAIVQAIVQVNHKMSETQARAIDMDTQTNVSFNYKHNPLEFIIFLRFHKV